MTTPIPIKLMADYHCYPLWQMNEAGNLDPDQLPLSTILKKHLKNWTEWYDDTLVTDDPLSSGFKNLRDSVLFEEEGKFLWQQLQRELDEEYEVFYFSHLKGRMVDLKELKKAA